MGRYADQLQEFIRRPDSAPRRGVSERIEPELTSEERRLMGMLKTQGERSIKGREIGKCVFEARDRNGGTTIMMILEGRHSMSVGKQVARRFDEMRDELKFIEVNKTQRGAIVSLRLKEVVG